MTLEQLIAIKGVLAETHGNTTFNAQSIILLQVFENCIDAAIAATADGLPARKSAAAIAMDIVKLLSAQYPTIEEVTDDTDLCAYLNEGERNDLIDDLLEMHGMEEYEGTNFNSFGKDASLTIIDLARELASAYNANFIDNIGEDEDDDTDENEAEDDDSDEDESRGVLTYDMVVTDFIKIFDRRIRIPLINRRTRDADAEINIIEVIKSAYSNDAVSLAKAKAALDVGINELLYDNMSDRDGSETRHAERQRVRTLVSEAFDRGSMTLEELITVLHDVIEGSF